MGIVFTTLFLLVSYMSPAEIFPALAASRPELTLAILALVGSIPAMLRNPYQRRMPQVYLLVGLIGAVAFSRLANGYLGASLSAVLDFSTAAFSLYFVLFNAVTLRSLRIVAVAVIGAAIYLTIQGVLAYLFTSGENTFIIDEFAIGINGAFETIRRIRGAGILGDPNDTAQFLIVALALLGLGWKQGGIYRLCFVVIPALLLVIGVYFTRSRGGLLGLLFLVATVLAGRMGKVKSGIFSAVLGIAAVALNFTGNRGISMSAGADRLDVWRDGWGMFKSSPLWGIGFEWFTRQSHYTAHNSFVLCFAELGLIGYFFWMALIVFSLCQLRAIARFEAKNQMQLDLQRWAKVVRTALYSFLVTSWFLSRTYSITFYVLIGMSAGLMALMRQETEAPEMQPKWSWTGYTVVAEFGTILLIYATLKVRGLS